ncbi:MAG TPA: AAA family ATPase [Steroidobacteraceae bacterium]
MRFVVLIGASGSGKTTIASALEQRYGDEVEVFHFDRIGVPSMDRMVTEYGSGEAWQRAKTFEWMAKLAQLCGSERGVLFEGQTRLSFLAEAAEAAGITTYFPILVDCDDETRVRRLSRERQQPGLASEHLVTWANYLRREAKERGCDILDTSGIGLDQCIDYVMAQLLGGSSR